MTVQDPSNSGLSPKPEGVEIEFIEPMRLEDRHADESIDQATLLNGSLPAPTDDETRLVEKSKQVADEATVIQQEKPSLLDNQDGGETVLEPSKGFTLEPPITDTTPKVGDLLNKQYRLEQQLGQGGMGSVFKALDLTKQEVHAKNPYVAIKLLLPELASDETLVTGFHREAEKAQKLTHPNIIKVFVANRDGDRHYIVMEYLQGEPLNRIIRNNGAMPLDKAWPIIRAMGRGLAHAHENDLIHSDFKPANVFVLEKTGEVKILDFGIASELKKTGDQEETIFDPRAHGGLTTLYASFEMLSGAKSADPRDDIYAFGLVCYELLTGQHPYNRKSASEIYLEKKRGDYQPPPQPPGISKKQWQLLSQAIAIEQENRPSSLNDWLKAFDPEATHQESSWRGALIPVAGILVVILAVGIYLWQASRSLPITDAEQVSKTTKSAEKAPPPVALPSPPVANAGANQQASVGQSVTLDGNASKASDGGLLNYAWQLVKHPENSTSALINSTTATPQLLPDRPGLYSVQLIVTDARNQASQPVNIEINAIAPVPKLQLKTSQSQYRIGQYLKVNVQPSEDGYLGIVYLSSTGEKLQIFPNGYQENSQVKAGKTYQVPPKKKPDMLQIQPPEGTDTIIAVFSKQRLPDLETHIASDGSITGLQQDAIVEQTQYQVIKN